MASMAGRNRRARRIAVVAIAQRYERPLYWTDRHFVCGRFPLLDRIDYLDHAVALIERESVRPTRPTPHEIQQYMGGQPLANWVDRALRLAGAETLDPKDYKACLRAFLYPARFCYSWLTGLVGSNDDAVAFLTERPSLGLDLGSIARALQCRHDAEDPVALFRPLRVLARSSRVMGASAKAM
jgi:hypothetical protein